MFSLSGINILIGFSLLLLPVIFFLLTLLWKQKVKRKLGDIILIERLTANYSFTFYLIKFIVIVIALALLIVSVIFSGNDTDINASSSGGIDMMLVMDVSKSMMSKDVRPSRIDLAKQLATTLVDNIDNSRMGLAIFAGEPLLQMPVTTDKAAAAMYINDISTDAIEHGGTNIGAAMELCDSALMLHEKKQKIIVLISDGEDHAKETMSIVNRLRRDGITVFAVGVGTALGSYIEDGGNVIKDNDGEIVTSRLNEKELKDIAEATNGKYFLLHDADKTAGEVIASLMKLNVNEKPGGFSYWIVLIPTLIILIGEVFIPEIKKGYR